MLKNIIKIITALLFTIFSFIKPVLAPEISINSNIMLSSGITLTKLQDIHMGTVVGLSSPIIGFLSLDASNNAIKQSLNGVIHLEDASCGKVAIDAPIGQTLAIWVQQPTVGSCGVGTLWGSPKCKILGSNDSTIVISETRCLSTDGVTLNVTESPYYLYVGGILSFFYGHTCHLGADAIANIDNATGTHTVHVAQQ